MASIETPVMLRTSERATYRRCRQKWQWKYVDLLSHPRPKGALTFGSLVHVALEHYYPPGVKRGVHPAKTFERVYAENAEYFVQWDDEGNKVPALELGTTMLNGYVEQWKEKDKDLQIISPEQTFAIDVYDKHGNYLCTYVGKVDAVARRRSTKKLVLLEHKTAKTIEEVSIISGYGEQGLSYLWATVQWLRHEGLIGEDEVISEVLFNVLRKGLPDTKRARNAAGLYLNQPTKGALLAALGLDPETRMTVVKATARLEDEGWTPEAIAQLGEPSKVQSSPLFHREPMTVQPESLEQFGRRLRGEAWEMGKVRQGMLPIYKNPTKDCSWECEFRDLCELHEMGADWREYRDIELTTWDPYNDHEYLQEKS